MMIVLQRVLFSLAAIVWGVLMVAFYVSGKIDAYLVENFRIYCLIGGLGLCVLGLFTLLTARDRSPGCGHDHGDGQGCDHDHEESDLNPFFGLIMMLVPVLLCAAFTEHRYSDEAIQRKIRNANPPPISSIFSSKPPVYDREFLAKTKKRTESGAYEIPLMEVSIASADEEMRETLSGLDVSITGQIVPETVRNPEGNRLRLFKLFMTCCAADSRPVSTILEFPDASLPDYDRAAWYAAEGTLAFEVDGNVMVPVISVKTIERVPTPRGQSPFGF